MSLGAKNAARNGQPRTPVSPLVITIFQTEIDIYKSFNMIGLTYKKFFMNLLSIFIILESCNFNDDDNKNYDQIVRDANQLREAVINGDHELLSNKYSEIKTGFYP